MCFAFFWEKTCGQVMSCPNNLSTSARVNYPWKGARETAGVNQESSSDLSRAVQLALLKMLPNATLSRMYLF